MSAQMRPSFVPKSSILKAFLSLLICGLCACSAGEAKETQGAQETNETKTPSAPQAAYALEFRIQFEPGAKSALAEVRVSQSVAAMRELDLNMPAAQYQVRSEQENIERQGDRVSWRVPEQGGALAYTVHLPHLRGQAYDAYVDADWALLRFEDVFPAARVRTLRASTITNTRVIVDLPTDWNFASRYGDKAVIDLPDAGRRYQRPTGWLLAGDVATRREEIQGRRVAVGAPRQSGVRRLDILSFLNWTLPEIVTLVPEFPERLLIVSGGDPMWRGGLSAPGSLFVHAERPLVSENGTSTLIHELMHVGGLTSAAPGDDWIVEGLAEYYSIELLRRSGGLSQKRFERTLQSLDAWAQADRGQLTDPSKGADTAYAVLRFHALAEALPSGGIDLVTRRLLVADEISRSTLREAVAQVSDEQLDFQAVIGPLAKPDKAQD